MAFRPIYKSALLACLLLLASIFSTCSPPPVTESVEHRMSTQIVLDWNRLLLELERHTHGYRPPVTARMFAYAEMAAYEAALPDMKGYQSLEKYYAGYHKPVSPTKNYHLPTALNAAYASIARNFFPTAPPPFLDSIYALEAKYSTLISQKTSAADIETSKGYGRETAVAVWAYSMQDSIGHDGFLYNFDRNFKAKMDKGCWKMDPERPMPPLLPNWGNTRPFVVVTAEHIARPPIPYDEAAPSAYFSEAMEVFSISNAMSAEEKWIADFWSDDHPGLTISATGRWISITNQAIEKSTLAFPDVMETYLKTAIAICDAAIVCWDNKYRYQIERPETFIRKNIRPGWQSLLHSSPPFPGYPSGHAIFGAAAAEVLSKSLGDGFQMVDRTHEGRREFYGRPRNFKSIYEMANENAYSRVLLGVHFRMDCEEGLRLGKEIGKKVAALPLRSSAFAEVK